MWKLFWSSFLLLISINVWAKTDPGCEAEVGDGTTKNFDEIVKPYAFFEAHSNEAEVGQAALVDYLGKPGKLMDFGCGDGSYLEGLLKRAGSDPADWNLELVDVAEDQLVKAQQRFPGAAISTTPKGRKKMDVILSSHVLYYVPLKETIDQLRSRLAAKGKLILVFADDDNDLIKYWRAQYRRIGKDLPYHLQEEIFRALDDAGLNCKQELVASHFDSLDSPENRDLLARFLLGPDYDFAAGFGGAYPFQWFDDKVEGGRLRLNMQDWVVVCEEKK